MTLAVTDDGIGQEPKFDDKGASYQALLFLKSRCLLVLVVSLVVLTPCFWHPRIEAGDFGSHTYNAWLTTLIEKGQAPGLYLAWQPDNLLVDLGLAWFGKQWGFIAAEKIVASICVLCFFWGAFAFISASMRSAPWFLVPAIAMITYGYAFYSGFMNYYLSLGLAFFAATLFWRGNPTDWLVGLLLAALTFVAHPIGFVILVTISIYLRLAQGSWHTRYALLGVGIIALAAMHSFFLRFRTLPGLHFRGLLLNGADQLLLFGGHYRALAEFVVAFGCFCFCFAAFRDRGSFVSLKELWPTLSLWALLVLTAATLPAAVWLPNYVAPVSALATRLTSVTAIVGLCILGTIHLRKWMIAGLVVCAAIYFGLQYEDTAALNKMEQQTEMLVSKLPYGTRVSYTVTLAKDDDRINFRHFVDRACIGHCFAYSNYEPGTGQFRVRVSPNGSPIVSDSGLAMELGEYIVRPSDLPLAQIYQPDESNLTKLAIRELQAGDKNGRIGHHPPASDIALRLSSLSR